MTSLESHFRSFSQKIGKDALLEALRTHYRDVCCRGDLIVHDILKAFEDETSVIAVEDYSEVDSNILAVILYWSQQGYCTPEPSWAM